MVKSENCSIYCHYVSYALFNFFTQSQNLLLSTGICISKQFGKDLPINLTMKIEVLLKKSGLGSLILKCRNIRNPKVGNQQHVMGISKFFSFISSKLKITLVDCS